ncbi:MAG: hypothetical protein K2F78_01535 [Muribaculaceae bacterium]|nr:hypothetical protein [Muribaculaceae bacterium]
MSSHAARRSPQHRLKPQTHGDDKDVIAPPRQPNGATTSLSSHAARRSPSHRLKSQTPGDDKNVIAPPRQPNGEAVSKIGAASFHNLL